MRKLALVAVLCALVVVLAGGSVPAAQFTYPPFAVYQAYPSPGSTMLVRFAGFSGAQPVARAAQPGFFDIDPGLSWKNYVTAARAGQVYTLKTVTLVKQTPQPVQCSEVYLAKKITQTGAGIRLHWPLMYEAPGTTWKLTILYGTKLLWNGGYVHQDTWTWRADASFDSLLDLLVLFHEAPFGLDEVPLISDEALFPELVALISNAKAAYTVGNKAAAAAYLSQFELEVADRTIGSSPLTPVPSGWEVGVAQTAENPAACKLLVDVEYLLAKYGINGFVVY
jgi:hypothetical protein